MDLYNVIISPKALSQLDSYIDYIQSTLLNYQAAYNVWQDAMETQDTLAATAGSLNLCSHPQLQQLGYHCITFRRHKYIMLYRLDGKNAYVDAIYHQLQDYENLFAKELPNRQ